MQAILSVIITNVNNFKKTFLIFLSFVHKIILGRRQLEMYCRYMHTRKNIYNYTKYNSENHNDNDKSNQ